LYFPRSSNYNLKNDRKKELPMPKENQFALAVIAGGLLVLTALLLIANHFRPHY
jgi:hypothetical protein